MLGTVGLRGGLRLRLVRLFLVAVPVPVRTAVDRQESFSVVAAAGEVAAIRVPVAEVTAAEARVAKAHAGVPSTRGDVGPRRPAAESEHQERGKKNRRQSAPHSRNAGPGDACGWHGLGMQLSALSSTLPANLLAHFVAVVTAHIRPVTMLCSGMPGRQHATLLPFTLAL